MLVPSPVPVEVMAWCWRDVVRLSVDPALKVDPKQLQVRCVNIALSFVLQTSHCLLSFSTVSFS